MSSKRTPLERVAEDYAVAKARAWGMKTRKMNGLGNKDWPDQLFAIPGGRPFFIEFKRENEVPSPTQDLMISELKECGYDIEVHDNKYEALEAVIARLEAAPVSERLNKILIRARRWRTVCRPRGG